MNIRTALGIISSMDSNGNRAGSDRESAGFTNSVTSVMRNVGLIEERPNGSNGYPTFILNGVSYQIKTSKGNKPMWNESFVRTDSVLILNLAFGTVIVHGSLVTDIETEAKLIKAKDFVANYLRDEFPNVNENFFVSGGRVQFGDNIDWKNSRVSFLNETLKILEKGHTNV